VYHVRYTSLQNNSETIIVYILYSAGSADSMFMCDPTSFGTPLAMLHIPARAIHRIQEKVNDKDCAVTHYTQDCRRFSDLRKETSAEDSLLARRAMIDVGYICKKCHMVYPGRTACLIHQQTQCFLKSNSTELKAFILKLEQLQYECTACHARCSTVDEYKEHCRRDQHKLTVRRTAMQSPSVSRTTPSMTHVGSTNAQQAVPPTSLIAVSSESRISRTSTIG